MEICAICQDVLRDDRALPCLHSFCRACLAQLLETAAGEPQLSCPVCRGAFTVPEAGVDHFPRLYFTSNLASHAAKLGKVLEKPNEIECDFCEEGEKEEAAHFCLDCREFYCAGCQRIHKRTKAYASHAYITVEEATLQNPQGTKITRSSRCSLHPLVELSAVCEKDGELVCHQCVMEHHNGHLVARLEDVIPKRKEEIVSMLTRLEKRKEPLEKLTSDLQGLLDGLETDLVRCKEEISAAFDEIRAQLGKREEQLVEELEEARGAMRKELLLHKEGTEVLLQGITTTAQFGWELLEEGTLVEVGMTARPLLARCATLQGTPCSTTPIRAGRLAFQSSSACLGEAIMIFGLTTWDDKERVLEQEKRKAEEAYRQAREQEKAAEEKNRKEIAQETANSIARNFAWKWTSASSAQILGDALSPHLTNLRLNDTISVPSMIDYSSHRYLVIGDADAVAIAAALPQMRQLAALDLSWNSIGAKGAVALAAALPQLPQLATLILSGNRIGSEGARSLAAALTQMPRLATLHLCENEIGPGGAMSLATALPKMPQLATLNLSGKDIGAEGAKALAAALPKIPQLKTLILNLNQTGDVGARSLTAALSQMPQLATLDLDRNLIGAAGARSLALALPHMRELAGLNLRNNTIGTEGAEHLAFALPHMPQLVELDLSWNKILDAGAMALASALPRVPLLSTLDLSNNLIGADGARTLAAALPQMPRLATLHLGDNEIGAAGAVALAAALPQMPQLATLDLSWNKIGAEGARTLAATLPKVPQLKNLSLGQNKIDEATENELSKFKQIRL